MKKIYLFCAQGLSTSMLVSRMQDIANSHNVPVKIKAFPHSQMERIVKEDRPDCILLGPQVKFLYEDTVKKHGNMNIPISVINDMDYGRMDGEKILKTAIKIIKQRR